MRIWTGKMMELIGMIVVLCGFLYGVRYSLIRFELGALLVGSAIFYGGWLLEKRLG
jgi:inner membrane protein involved in colicin E2 resistance